ncbi:hypothetical protein PILCRDRAFT_91206 [Piloderma croceum F 1598]|uniref:Uncharacterized protein n=1 Tax=Piloderma croceum (strain F 1598) TaxID=765440 RepID=A0A0C3EXS3_PILCF|nr:hypothetical protein PILCRDRAFT_91206 [Piloderma croceum F 1598]
MYSSKVTRVSKLVPCLEKIFSMIFQWAYRLYFKIAEMDWLFCILGQQRQVAKEGVSPQHSEGADRHSHPYHTRFFALHGYGLVKGQKVVASNLLVLGQQRPNSVTGVQILGATLFTPAITASTKSVQLQALGRYWAQAYCLGGLKNRKNMWPAVALTFSLRSSSDNYYASK